ncbi:FxLYD domain-containing protein [Virgibacillus ainsalahensis]
MLHCPYCGTGVKNDEHYCVKCGRQLPEDINTRSQGKKQFNKIWLLPLAVFVLTIISTGIYYLILQNQTAQAKELYAQGEHLLMKEDFVAAKDLFAEALNKKDNFDQAETSLGFADEALQIQTALDKTDKLLEKQDFQQALSLVNEAENNLNNYNGTAVNQLIDSIVQKRETIQISQLNNILEKEPDIDELKILLWEADDINNKEAKNITSNIRNQIIEFSFSEASEQLNNKQFNDAQILVEDGLKYAPDSEKLQSLKTTIEKEKTAFETARQQRIEQAINTAAKEQQLNETDAIEIVSATIDKDEQGNFAVKGEVESVATVPIHSIQIEYSILNENGTETLSNKVFVFPDRLYPGESGKFEFTHFDIGEQSNNLDVEVNKITWYTNE